jgi:hypothetical protein
MGTTYEEDEWGKDLMDELADELDDDGEESWLPNDERRSKPTSPGSPVGNEFGSRLPSGMVRAANRILAPHTARRMAGSKTVRPARVAAVHTS